MDDKVITKEMDVVDNSATKSFDKVSNDSASLYEFAGGEECLCEFVRAPSYYCTQKMCRIKWLSLKNTRFVVYATFAVILGVFAVYYSVTGPYYVAAMTGVVCLFMLYILFFGQSYFVNGMEFDERAEKNATLSVKLCKNNMYIYDSKALTVADYSQITEYRITKKYVYLRLKNAKPYTEGLIVLIPESKDNDFYLQAKELIERNK